MKPLLCSRALLAGLPLWTTLLLAAPPLGAQQSGSAPAKEASSETGKPPGLSIGLPQPNQSPAFAPLPVGPSEGGRLPLIPNAPDSPSAPANEPGKELGDFPDFELNTRRPNAPLPDGPNRTEEAALLRTQRIRYRETKARALLLPDVIASLEATRKSRSDRELRSTLKAHYELLYAKMSAMQPSLAPLIETQRQRSIDALTQANGPHPSQSSRLPAASPFSSPASQNFQP